MLAFPRSRLSREAKGAADAHLQDDPLRRNKDSSPSAPRGPQPTVSEIIEQLGAGPAQLRAALLSGSVWFVDGAEILLISSAARAVAEEWHLSHVQRAAVVSLVFAGVCFGNAISGPVSDHLGRRLPILASFLFIFAFSIGSGLAWSYLSLCCFRLLVGFAFGLGQPAQQALICEVTPSNWRVIFSNFASAWFILGELFSGVILFVDDPTMRDLHWRSLLMIGATPCAFFGVLALLFLQQSPLYLACGGRYDETREVLASMRHANWRPDVAIDFRPHKVLCGGSGVSSALARQLRIIFGRDLLLTTLIMSYSCFVANMGMYGSLYAFPSVMMRSKSFGSSPVASLIYGALMELAALFASIACALFLERKSVMRIAMLLSSSAFLSFAVACPVPGSGLMKEVFVFYGYYGIKFGIVLTLGVVYLYNAEVFPTSVRTTGTGLALAAGRLGAIAGPLVFGAIMTTAGGRYELFFYALALLTLVNLVLVGLLPYETFGKPLSDESAALSMEEEQWQYGTAR